MRILSLYVRRSCYYEETELACASEGAAHTDTIRLPVDAYTQTTVLVDANQADAPADFVLRGRFVGDSCGDGVVDYFGDRCDDGNAETGDGCTPECDIEPGALCAGAEEVTAATMTGTTVGAANRFGASCTGSGPDRVYHWVPGRLGQRGTLRVGMTSTEADLGIYIVRCDDSSELACVDLALGETTQCADCATVCNGDGTCDPNEHAGCADCCTLDAFCAPQESDDCPDCSGHAGACNHDGTCDPHEEVLQLTDYPGGTPIGIVVDSQGGAGAYTLTFAYTPL